MNKIKISAICLSLLAPNLGQAGTCMDFDKDFNIIEYECDNTIKIHSNDININQEFVDTDIRLILRAAISPINDQSIKIYESPDMWNGLDYQSSFNIDPSFSFGFGVRISKPKSWFQDIEIGITQFNNLATRFTTYNKDLTFDATAYMLSYNLGYNINKRFYLYITAGIARSKYNASANIMSAGFENSQSSTWTKLGTGLEFAALSWLNLYTEFSYHTDLGNDDNFWVASNFDILGLSIGLKVFI